MVILSLFDKCFSQCLACTDYLASTKRDNRRKSKQGGEIKERGLEK